MVQCEQGEYLGHPLPRKRGWCRTPKGGLSRDHITPYLGLRGLYKGLHRVPTIGAEY